MVNRNCPSCNDVIEYKHKSSYYHANKINSVCKKCNYIRISEKKKGKPLSESHKKSLSNAKIGKKLTEEHKVNIGKSVRGLRRSEESKINYSISKMGDKNPSKRKDVRDKIKKSVLEKYEKCPYIKDKISKSVSEYFLNSNDYVSSFEIDEYRKYRRIVKNMTNRNKKYLLDIWDGTDYYDGEYIKENYKLDYNNKQYPTIDHKISIIYGFKNGYPPEFISSVDNLCITKRSINVEKRQKCEIQFKEIFILR